MKQSRSEAGYTLVVTLGIFVLFMVLGFSLMTLTMSGVKKNESRESHVQAQDLAVKGQDFLVTKLQYELKKQLSSGKNASEFKNILENTLNSYKCPASHLSSQTNGKKALQTSTINSLPEKFKQNNTTGETYFCISDWIDEPKGGSATNPYKKLVTILTVGDSTISPSEKHYQTRSQHAIGSNLVINPFYYAVSTHKNADGSGGNVKMNGGLGVKGNILAANDLTTSDQSTFKNIPIETIKPTLQDSSVQVAGTIKTTPNTGTSNSLANSYSSLSKNVYPVSNDVAFNDILKVGDLVADHRELMLSKTLAPTNMNWGNSTSNKVNNMLLVRELTSTIPYTYLESPFDNKFEDSKKWNINLLMHNTFKNIYFPQNVDMRYSTSTGGNNYSAKLHVDSALIEGNFYLGYLDGLDNQVQTNYDDFKFDTAIKQDIELKGDYYINGDLTMTNVRLTGNFNLYVKGKVDIYFSQFNNVTGNIFADGNVTMKYISHQGQSPETRYRSDGRVTINAPEKIDPDDSESGSSAGRSVWNGYIYSNKNLNYNSPTSFLQINGGLHGKNVELSSVRGRSRENCLIAHNRREFERYSKDSYSNCFDSARNQLLDVISYYKVAPSSVVSRYEMPILPRLQITYNTDFIKDYLGNKRIYQTDSPQILSQEIVN